MKTVLTILVAFFTLNTYAQDISVTATRQHWVGGACCFSGTDYSITVKADSSELKRLAFHHVIIDGYKFELDKNVPSRSSDSTIIFFFGTSSSKFDKEILEETIEKVEKHEGTYISFTYQKRKVNWPINAITELPIIPYP